jgi:hypothetical protein
MRTTWLHEAIIGVFKQMRWSYLPPLMVYFAYGISGLTGIVGTFFVKEYLDLSAAFLAALGFWADLRSKSSIAFRYRAVGLHRPY